MNRNQKLKLNTGLSLLNQLVTIICGFILPRLILAAYGSNVNGLVSSITQFLSLISLCELGVGAVVQSSLYKPLADNDNLLISRIMVSARNFFNKVGYILCGYVVVLLIVLPLQQSNSFAYLTTAMLIFSMSISFFAQYFFGVKNQLLLNADQKSYVQLFYQMLTTILNTVVCIILIKLNFSIQFVKLATSIVFLIRPLGMMIYVKKNYKIDYSSKLSEEPIKQKWNGLAQHVAAVVLGNTDTVVLTFFSTLINVSIYAVYNLVVSGVKQVVVSLTTGVQSLMGNMLAKNETETLNVAFDRFEFVIHFFTTLIFTITGLLIVPFVQVYTRGINDANYVVPLFAVLITIATASYCLRLPYSTIVLSAGHYKQTQQSAIVEMLINIVLSIVLVFSFGLIGVAIGTLAAMTYRTFYYALYLRKNIINRSLKKFVKQLIVDVISIFFMIGSTFWIKLTIVSFWGWFIMAVKVGCLCVAVSLVINIIFNRKHLISVFKR